MAKKAVSWVLVGVFAYGWWWLGHGWAYLNTAGNEWSRVFVLLTLISLVVPADALWRLAAYYMMPAIIRDLEVTPFNSMYPPSGAMVVWAIGYIAVVGAIAVRQFNTRAL